MSVDSPSSLRKWFALVAAFAIAVASAALWVEHRREMLRDSSRRHDEEPPVPEPAPPPVRPRNEFQPPPPPEKPTPPEPLKPPPEVSPSLSSTEGTGPATPKKSVVPPLPSLWSLLFQPWLIVVAVAAILILALWQWKRRIKAGPS